MSAKPVKLGFGLRVMSDDSRACVMEMLPQAILLIAADDAIEDANAAAETFFDVSKALLVGQKISRLLPFGSSVLTLIEQVRERGAAINEYKLDLGLYGPLGDRRVDAHCALLPQQNGAVLLVLQERTIADKIDRQLTHVGAARSVSGLASMLAHEIKNPLSGIRGAAQLLETGLSDEDRALTQLICDETDRIVRLVDRMEVFGDERPVEREPVNIHVVLEHVKKLAYSGFARHIRFLEEYDPSLPPVLANRDQLIQVFLNLIKNAAEAIGDAPDGEIQLTTAFRPGVPEDLMPHLFDPFVTTKPSGSGLGLALVAKIVGDHGGVIECESQPRRTIFRVLMPKYAGEGQAPPGTPTRGS